MSIRALGKTTALLVAASSHAAVTVGDGIADSVSKAAFLNTGTGVVACTVSNGTAAASVLPVDGTPAAANIVLPASMLVPLVFDTPKAPFSLTAIAAVSGSVIYVTPCEE